jgi:glycosyltransferase involved in cell wall biosynthesis
MVSNGEVGGNRGGEAAGPREGVSLRLSSRFQLSQGEWERMRENVARGRTINHFSQEQADETAWRPARGQMPERQRVAIVGPSGASLAVALGDCIREMLAHGHEVTCLAPALDAQASRTFGRMGVQALPLPSFRQGLSPIGDTRNIIRLSRLFRQMEPDIVAGYSPKGAALAAMAGRIARVNHVVSLLAELGRGFAEAPEKSSAPARQFQKNLLRVAFRLSDTAVFFNEENHKILRRHNVVPARIRQFPFNGGGVDLRQFPEMPLPPLDKGVMFLFAGPLDRRLGIQDYCEAARLLRAKSGNYRCLLAGPEVKGPHGFSLAELKRYRDAVQYMGPQADPRPFVARTHVFVLPATGDAVPNPLIEAMAMGRPVITTTARGCRGAVREGANGILVPAGDPAALASAMARLLLRPDLIPSMARASRALAENRFDSRRINEQLLNALGL